MGEHLLHLGQVSGPRERNGGFLEAGIERRQGNAEVVGDAVRDLSDEQRNIFDASAMRTAPRISASSGEKRPALTEARSSVAVAATTRSGARPRTRSLRMSPRCATGESRSTSGRKMRPSQTVWIEAAAKSDSACAASSTANGKWLTGESACRERAATSAPDPGSLVMTAARKCGATRRICDQTRAMAALGPSRASSPV
jgi:hypothetical protein